MTKGFVYSILSAVAFSVLVILGKLGFRENMSSMLMMQCRFTFGVAILFVYMLFFKPALLRVDKKMLVRYAFIGLVICFTQSYCYIEAAKYIPAATDSLVFYFYPVLVTILSAYLYKMRIDSVVVASLSLVILGCGFVFFDAFQHGVDMYGLMLAIVAMAIFSCYLLIIQKLLTDDSPLRATFYILLFTSISFNMFGDVSDYWTMTQPQIVIGLLLGLLPTVVAMLFQYAAIERIGSAWASIFSSIEPVLTVLAACWLLGDEFIMLQFGGALLIILGIVLPQLLVLFKLKRLERHRAAA